MSKKSGIAAALEEYRKNSGEGMNIMYLEKETTREDLTQILPDQKTNHSSEAEQNQTKSNNNPQKEVIQKNIIDAQTHIPFRVIGFKVKNSPQEEKPYKKNHDYIENLKNNITDTRIIAELAKQQEAITEEFIILQDTNKTDGSNSKKPIKAASKPILIPRPEAKHTTCGSVFSMEFTPPTNLEKNIMSISGETSLEETTPEEF